jgi:hypothetical protein
MSSKPKVKKVQSALGLAHLSVPQMLANAQHYVQQMTGNANFPSPTPTLASITTQIGVLTNAYNLSLTRVKGSVETMHLEEKILHSMLTPLAAYVEGIANADPVNAVKIFLSSGMPQKRTAVHNPKTFTVVNGKLKGSVVINSKATRGATYIYQMTTDQTNAGSWVTIYSAGKVKFTKLGLTSGTKYYFRMAQAIKGVQGNFGDVLELLVL